MNPTEARAIGTGIAATLRTVSTYIPDPKVTAGLYLGALAAEKGFPYVVDLIAAIRAGLTDEELNALVDARKSRDYSAYDPNLAADLAAAAAPKP